MRENGGIINISNFSTIKWQEMEKKLGGDNKLEELGGRGILEVKIIN